ncbi:MAG TPA: EAL domain-containing protein [Anaeromyxobacter sp.]|nr:EAL domain-containing protein [Anaeromyxobacter sp.]
MRRRITFALLVIFACSTLGTGAALLYVRRTTEELGRVIRLHRIGEMRQNLIIASQTAQFELYKVNTPLGESMDAIADNVLLLEEAAARCDTCHHEPEVAARIRLTRQLVTEYQHALSYYITASADRGRIAKLQADAAAVSASLLRETEAMAIQASRRAEERTVGVLARYDQARVMLTVVAALAFLAAVGAAYALARGVTRPIDRLVAATRAIADGQLGFSVPDTDPTEFGELARHFNAMSTKLRDGYAALQREIVERKAAEARLAHDAFHDALTGLPNRALFRDRLAHAIGASRRHPDERYAVLFLDIDRFKVVNDSLGHAAGDHLLVIVAQRLAGSIRPGDTVARLGGDEFGVLLEGIKAAGDAAQVADRIHAALATSVDLDGHETFVSASIGIAIQSERYAQPEQVLRDADVAMYQAKLKGKGCSVEFDARMHGSVVERMQLEADLHRAVEHGDEFVLHYQPIVALRTGRPIGVEALLRWRHPVRGLLPAGEFVAIAEESGVLIPMGLWAIQRACDQLREWEKTAPALAPLVVGVNVSGRQLRRSGCVEEIRQRVLASGIDPRRIAVEVTESALMGDVETSANRLAALREMGVQIHVDDFGTGYSSLSYLHRFPITAVKIDRSFVEGLVAQPESADVVKAIVSIAESLDFDVIAEGVETEAQASMLEQLRCRYGQGHFLSPPLDAAELERWAAGRVRGVVA